jgi:hypothetical protein
VPWPCFAGCLGYLLRSLPPHRRHRTTNLPRAFGMPRPPGPMEFTAIWKPRNIPFGGGQPPLKRQFK